MKKFAIALILSIMLVTPSIAADMMLDAKLISVSQQTDKNGNLYTRAIIIEERSLEGVKYEDTVAVMAFGEMAAPLATYKEGEQLKAVVGSREYQGRTSYTVKKLIAD
jgi:hypothetical protein